MPAVTTPRPTTVILGWGNPARGDDGLGQALVERLLAPGGPELGPEIAVSADYQLQIEDAAEIARHDRVVFVDADRTGPEPFSCRRLQPSAEGLSFTTHSVTPGALLALSEKLFGRRPEAWMVGIRGYAFDAFDEELSRRARRNLAAAASFLAGALSRDRFEDFPPSAASGRATASRLAAREEVA